MRPEDLLTLTQWLSPAYPVGSFAWSHGLEAAIHDGDVADAAALGDWIDSVLTHGAGRSDAILLAAAWRAGNGAALAEIAGLAAALSPTAARRAETLQQGAAFAATTRAVWRIDLPDMAWPVVVGRAAGLRGLPLTPVLQLWLQAVAANLVQVAQRLMPLGQTAGQRLLAQLAPRCIAAAALAEAADPDDIGGCALAIDIASARQEAMHVRLFRS